MKRKVIYSLNFLWASIIAFSFPICLGWIYQDITGHSKGFSYDLGSEKSVSVMMGCIELLIWLVLAIPSNLYVFKKAKEKAAYCVVITVVTFVILFLLCIYLIGGWNEFSRFFHP